EPPSVTLSTLPEVKKAVPPPLEAIDARSIVSPKTKPLIVADGIAEPKISSVPAPEKATAPLATAPVSSTNAPPLMTVLLGVPPADTPGDPTNTVPPMATPPDEMVSVPPLIRPPTSLPPDSTTCKLPLSITELLAAP